MVPWPVLPFTTHSDLFSKRALSLLTPFASCLLLFAFCLFLLPFPPESPTSAPYHGIGAFMSTQSQRDANRRNALQSTGPKTPEGKAAASRNALKHGLLARDAVLPGEDPNAFLQLQAALEDDLHPVGALEELLVQHIATSHWRLERIPRIETGTLENTLRRMRILSQDHRKDLTPAEQYDFDTALLGDGLANSTLGASLSNLARYENSIRRTFFKSLTELRQSQKLRPSHPQPQPQPEEPVGQVGNLRPIDNRPLGPIPAETSPAQPATPSPQTPNPEIGFVSSPSPESPQPVRQVGNPRPIGNRPPAPTHHQPQAPDHDPTIAIPSPEPPPPVW